MRLLDLEKELHQRASHGTAVTRGKMTFWEASEIYRDRITHNPDIKESTKRYYHTVLTALLADWKGLGEISIEKISAFDCEKWAAGFRKRASSSRFNNSLSVLRSILAIAIKAGARYSDPTSGLRRAPVRSKKLTLPNTEQFLSFLREVETAGGRFSKDCADFLRFLAFSGCRKTEAKYVMWDDVDFAKGEVVVRGDPVSGTKNGETRRVYMIPELRDLLLKIREARPGKGPKEPVLNVAEAQKAIDRACNRVGMARITHHDLRHLYATILIEHGIDIPTVARLLGHKDGGVLAMRTYGHLRDEHARKSLERVSFGCV